MKCRSCGAAIVWVKTEAGKAMPLDAVPALDGNIVVENGIAHVDAKADRNVPRYKSHFATCPNVAKHRKKDGK